MGQRRFLVIGSQCQKLNHLSFLPEVAVRFHALMVEPGPGECSGAAVGDPPGLLLDPTVATAKAAMEAAFEAAITARDTLILAYIGHGEFHESRGDFYLLPTDATLPLRAEKAIHLAQFIAERHQPDLDGLIVLLDTCQAGVGAWQAAERWVRSLEGRLRFEMLTATDDRATAKAWFTTALIQILERGDPAAPKRVRCQDARRRVLDLYPQLAPQLAAHNADDGLYLGRNTARLPGRVFWKDSRSRDQILKRTEYYQPTPQLGELVEASRAHPVVIVTGEAGVGKSTLAAALARPEVTDGLVPPGFAHAIALLDATTNLRSLAVDDLERQLRLSVPGFPEAVEEFQRSVPLAQRQRIDFLGQKVLRPLDYLTGPPLVRIVLDGFDQLPEGTRREVRNALHAIPRPLSLVITTRDDTPECPPGHPLRCGRTDAATLGRYLASRRVPEGPREALVARARGHWLIARLLADAVLADPGIDLARLPGMIDEAYAVLLDQAGAGAADAWRTRFGPVLGPLAVAGSGPIVPLPLLVHASADLDGPDSAGGSATSSSPSGALSCAASPARPASRTVCSTPPWPSTSSARRQRPPASRSMPRGHTGPWPGRSRPWPRCPTTTRTILSTGTPSCARRTTGGRSATSTAPFSL